MQANKNLHPQNINKLKMKIRVQLFLSIIGILASSASAQNTAFTTYQTLQVNDMNMSYRDIGDGPALVLLHGFTGTGETWNPYLEDLSAEFRLIIPDLRGHGRSINPSEYFKHRELALDVFNLLDQLGIDSIYAIGSSMGAMTLLHAATQQRERIKAMVLVGGSPYLPESARAIYRNSPPDSITEEGIERMSNRHVGGKEQVMQLMRQFHAYKDSYDDVNFTKPYLASIISSTLIVQGDRDQFFPVDVAMEMYTSIPNSYLWVVPNAGHGAGLREAKTRKIFTETVLDFLGGNWKN
jgi:pimeloyl-ACP methyl ester carboxylesterase